mmetsp:Transcript_6296/g.16402  ORF Transcript_6296/g.16402 Transcript_6296/m.16402 type:complete len:164 (+) Transcript_6296:67-558(+)
MATSMTDFSVAIAKGTALLALKIAGLHFMTMRTRFMTGDFNTGRGVVLKEDLELLAPVSVTLRTFFMAFGPVVGTVDRWTGCIRNANENEPYFIMLCLAFAQSGLTPPSWAPSAVYAYVAGRFLHMFVYTIVRDRLPQPVRGAGWTVAFATMIAMAVAVLQAA